MQCSFLQISNLLQLCVSCVKCTTNSAFSADLLALMVHATCASSDFFEYKCLIMFGKGIYTYVHSRACINESGGTNEEDWTLSSLFLPPPLAGI